MEPSTTDNNSPKTDISQPTVNSFHSQNNAGTTNPLFHESATGTYLDREHILTETIPSGNNNNTSREFHRVPSSERVGANLLTSPWPNMWSPQELPENDKFNEE